MFEKVVSYVDEKCDVVFNKINALKNFLKATLEKQEKIYNNTQILNDKIDLLTRELYALRTNIWALSINKHLEKFRNCLEGKTVVLVCTGPSLEYFEPIPEAVYVGVNTAYQFQKVKLDYLFVQDYMKNQLGKENVNSEINNYKGNNVVKFYGMLPTLRINEIKADNILPLPQVYSNQDNVYQYVIEDKLHVDFAKDISVMAFGDYGGTAFSALQWIMFTNPKKLYLVGCDCSGAYKDFHLYSWVKFKEFVSHNNPDLEIISVNPVSLKGFFKDIYTTDFINNTKNKF